MAYTMKDVAKRAGVSVATVSRILNGLSGYSEETKKRVNQVIDEMGYQPNAIARGLISKKTRTLAVLLPEVSDLFASEVLAGVEEEAHEKGYSVIICKTAKNGVRTMKYLQTLRENQVDGIIFMSETLTKEYYEAIRKMGASLVLVSTRSDYDIPYVKVDDRQAAYDATSYLVEKGHRSLGMLSGTEGDLIATVPRVAGFKDALDDHGLPAEEHRIAYGDFGFSSGALAMERLLRRVPDVEAVFCASDEMAVGALSLLHRKGIKVPGEISIIGYDNTRAAEMAFPPLTTMAQPLYQMGKKAVDIVLGHRSAESLLLSHQMVERETVGQR
mgnify:CR=1 FL=1